MTLKRGHHSGPCNANENLVYPLTKGINREKVENKLLRQ